MPHRCRKPIWDPKRRLSRTERPMTLVDPSSIWFKAFLIARTISPPA
jgi:hypothetical protein